LKMLVSMGRGGVGKSSFIALAAKYFIEAGETPLLLVDVDPDQSLGEMVGVDLKSAGILSISELLYETFLEEGGTAAGMPPSERIEVKIWEKGLYEGEHFDFMSIGTKYIEGCYCLPDAALKGALERLTKNYKYVLIDSPAGLEQLNRRITPKVNDIFTILDPSRKSFEHVKRAYRIIQSVNIKFDNIYLVGGYEFPDELGEKAEEETGLKYIGKIEYDEELRSYVLQGKSLLELPSNSPAYVSVKRILEKAGYISLKQLLFPES